MGRADELEVHQDLEQARTAQVLGPSKLEKPLANCSGAVALRSQEGNWSLGSIGMGGELTRCFLPRVYWEKVNQGEGRWRPDQHNIPGDPQEFAGAIEIPMPGSLIWMPTVREVYPGLRLVRRKSSKSLQCVIVDYDGFGLTFSDDETLGYLEFYSALERKMDVSKWLRATMEEQAKLLKELK